MHFSLTPQVEFRFEASGYKEPGRQLQSTLVDRLIKHEGLSVKQLMRRPPAKWVVFAGVNQESVLVGLTRSDIESEWIIQVGPAKAAPGYLQATRVFCQKIHGALSTISGIQGIYWHFEGYRDQGAVLSPDELSWTRTISRAWPPRGESKVFAVGPELSWSRRTAEP